jgi:TetR/AcrR family transcriptional regulator, transcriptional repressor for nem operon
MIRQQIVNMRYRPEQKQETRRRIVRAASRRFRSHGGEGITIADLMRDLRLTHGGFYRHFASKQELYAEAIAEALRESEARLSQAAEAAPRGSELRVLIKTYLSLEHCRDAGQGCLYAALASEIGRRPRAVRAAFEAALAQHTQNMARFLPGNTAEEREQNSVLLFSGMAGALNVARAVNDDRQRQRILDISRDFYIKAFCR